jgi:hypothetical protein
MSPPLTRRRGCKSSDEWCPDASRRAAVDTTHAAGTVRTVKTRLLLLAAVLSMSACAGTSAPLEPASFDPEAWFSPQWEILLGGDPSSPDEAEFDVESFSAATDVPVGSRSNVEQLISDVALAEATGTGRWLFGDYFPVNHPPASPAPSPPSGEPLRYCRDVSVVAVSTFVMPVHPVGSFVKALVLWRGDCPFPPPSVSPSEQLHLTAVYAADANRAAVPRGSVGDTYGGWVPTRPVEIPGARNSGGYRLPAPWELTELDSCSTPGVVVRIEVELAYSELCAAASAAGLGMLANEGLRAPQEQFEMFTDALERHGSEAKARLHIAYSDGFICESTHCGAEAIDLQPDRGLLAWVEETVGCLEPAGVYVAPPCGPSARPISRLESFGFVNPIPSAPYHLEYALGTLDADADLYGDCTPGPVDIAARVDAIFKCRLLESGLGADLASSTASQALRLAECTSRLDPTWRSFDGRFTDTEHPLTGERDDRAGLFGVSVSVAERWTHGGQQMRTTANSNIDTTARLFVEERRWGRWGWDLLACATGEDGTTAPAIGVFAVSR